VVGGARAPQLSRGVSQKPMTASTSLMQAGTRSESPGHSLGRDGFAVAATQLPASTCDAILRDLERASHPRSSRRRGGVRNLFDLVPAVRDLARASILRDLVEPVLGRRCFAVGATLFDKSPLSNWPVSWHQDLTIAVQEQRELGGWGPWSQKAGVSYVQPPASILENMLAVRVHLDQCEVDAGCLRVVPGSHGLGRLGDLAIAGLRQTGVSVKCPVARGGLLLMRPLLVHCSSRAAEPAHRRVVHLEYAGVDLPHGLKWHQRVEAALGSG